MKYDFVVIGGGIVGVSVAYKILKARPGASLILLEKEDELATHQTGRNSGVIHAGVYYAPGSLKAELCRKGLAATKEFCRENNIPVDECGKLIVATNDVEVARLDALYERATANDVGLERIDGPELSRLEPNIVGRKALLSPKTAIVDYGLVCRTLAQHVRGLGGEIVCGSMVNRIEERDGRIAVGASGRSIETDRLVVCAGVQSDRMARLAGIDTDFRIVPFRGEYFQLAPEKSDIVKHLIYPAPDPALPFLGIHLTRMIDGSITVGPNAVLGFAREGYSKFAFNSRDFADFALYPGFWALLARNWSSALIELRNSAFKQLYLRECRKYCPELTVDDLQPYRTGIRAQAVTGKGEALHDFLMLQTERSLHVCNAPSPAATSALPIADMIVERLLHG